MSDIEAAARALFLNLECEENHYIDPTKLPALRSALRSALAHAARGEPVRRWRDVEGTLPARRDGDMVARVDEMVPWFLAPTPPPATGEAKWPEIRDSGGRTDFALTPATSEAGTRGKPFGGYERERAAFDEWWADKSDEYKRAAAKGASLYGVAFDAYYARAISALPEAREGGG